LFLLWYRETDAVGIPVALFHYMLMGLVSVTTVTSFESVGAILVVGGRLNEHRRPSCGSFRHVFPTHKSVPVR
jgi:hypothetical protein